MPSANFYSLIPVSQRALLHDAFRIVLNKEESPNSDLVCASGLKKLLIYDRLGIKQAAAFKFLVRI